MVNNISVPISNDKPGILSQMFQAEETSKPDIGRQDILHFGFSFQTKKYGRRISLLPLHNQNEND